MSRKQLTINELRELIEKGEAKDPLVFLEAIMNGKDPRKIDGVFKLVMEIDAFTGGNLEKTDWEELVDYTINHAKYSPVTISDSTNAAKTLAEYLHPKRKQIEKIDGNTVQRGSAEPLTTEEIELFKEKFNDEF